MPIDYTQMTDPSTGKPFASQDAGQAWSNTMSGQAAAAGTDSGTKASDASLAKTGAGIDWSKTGWNVGTGDGSQWYTPPENMYGFQIGDSAGYIDPATGQITYGKKAPGMDTNAYLAAAVGQPGQYGSAQYQYDVSTDYGLGSAAKGIIPLEHNAQGQVTQYFAPNEHGGYQAFPDLASAIASRDAYISWKGTTNTNQGFGAQPAPAATTSAATTGTTTATPAQDGLLTKPGAGENYFDSTKDFYTNGQPTNAQKVFDQTPNQPTNSQQQWNAYSGIYGNPDYLTDYYKRQEQAAESTAERRMASAGIADSGAAAKSIANLPAVYGDRAIAGMNAFATTGQQMAGTADSSNIAQGNLRGNLATNADTQNLTKVTAGQTAANSAETQLINRETGGLSSATTLAQDQAGLVSANLGQAETDKMTTFMAGIDAQIQKGTLNAQQAYTLASNYASTIGIVGNTALNSYLVSKYTGGKANSGSATDSTYSTGAVYANPSDPGQGFSGKT